MAARRNRIGDLVSGKFPATRSLGRAPAALACRSEQARKAAFEVNDAATVGRCHDQRFVNSLCA
jgi:hypothetical protein